MGGSNEKSSQESIGDCDETAYLFLLYDKTNQKALKLCVMSELYPTLPYYGADEEEDAGRTELVYIPLLGKTEETYEDAERKIVKELKKVTSFSGMKCLGYYDRKSK